MNLSDKGLDFIVSSIRKVRPSCAVSYASDDFAGHANQNTKLVACGSESKKPPHNADLPGRKLVGRRALAAQVDQPRRPSVLAVLRARYPFQIGRSVVCLNAVDVIDAKAGFVPLAKCPSHKVVELKFLPLAVNLNGNRGVPVFLDIAG